MQPIRKTTLLVFLLSGLTLARAQKVDSAQYYYLKAADERAGQLLLPAYQDYKLAVKADPKNNDALRGAGLTAFELNRFAEAIPYFEQLNISIPKDSTAISKLATIHFYLHQWEKAAAFGQKALAAHAGSRINYLLGKSYYELEDYGHALNYLPPAMREEPKNSEIPYLMGRAYVDMSNFKPAISYYRQAIALDSTNNERIYECALIYANLNDDESALKYYDLAAAKGYKKDNDFYENLAESYIAANQPGKGLELLDNLLKKKPADLDLLNGAAFTSYKLKKYDKAIDYWDRILSFDKQNAKALYMIGVTYQRKGQDEKGKALCEKAIAMDPSLRSYRTELRMEQ